jgi:hypothetical protein
VEISVEDVNTPCKSTGVYSLEENEWIKEPKHLSDEIFDKDYVKETSAEIMTKIDDMEDELKNGSSIKRMKEIYRSADRLFDRLKDMRKKSLETKAGEMASDNIVWKVLRRAEYVGKLKDIINLTYDKTHSL